MSNGGPGFGGAVIPGIQVSNIGGGAAQRQQEQQQKGMLSSLMGMDMTGMSEQGIQFSMAKRDYLIDKILNDDDEDFGYEQLIRGITSLNDFLLRDKTTYAENLAVASPILNASLSDAGYNDLRSALEEKALFINKEDVDRYAVDYNMMLENPYGMGNYFNPSDDMVYVQDPTMAGRNMQQVSGQHVLGMQMPDRNSFQYQTEDIPTGDVFAYMKSGAEANLMSMLGAVDNSVDAKQKIRRQFQTFILGGGLGRKALQESLSALGYDIEDLAGKLAGTVADNEEGLQGALLEKNVTYASSFKDNVETIYKEFEEYYMDMWNADRRDKQARLNASKSGRTPKIEYNFQEDVTIGVDSSPNFLEVDSMLGEDSAIVSELMNSFEPTITGIPSPEMEEARDNILKTISDNKFLGIRNMDPVEFEFLGTNQPTFKSSSFSLIDSPKSDGSMGSWVILNGSQSNPIMSTSWFEPEPGKYIGEYTTRQEPNPDLGGQVRTKYYFVSDYEDTAVTKEFRISDPQLHKWFSAIGSTYMKKTDLDKAIIGDDMEGYYQRLGYAIVVKKAADQGMRNYNGDLMYPEGSMELSTARDIIRDAQIRID